MQELLPEHQLKEGKVLADKAKGTAKQWPFGWGKKKGDKDTESEAPQDAEGLQVCP